ncbi:MAG TPA: hypothetical protein VH598_07540, partial [Verrucomicrobiae bacterium]|nr:hypothetical protein [Verrucomicrobiae bacterium]
MTTRHLKPPIWVFPLIIAALVALFGWWGNARLRDTIEEQLKAQLTATLNANVTALEVWMTNQTKLAAFLAEEPKVRSLALTILEKSYQAGFDEKKPPDPSDEAALGNYLRPRLAKISYDTAQL